MKKSTKSSTRTLTPASRKSASKRAKPKGASTVAKERAKPGKVVRAKAAKPGGAGRAGRRVDKPWLPDGLFDYALALQTHGMLTGVVGKQRFAGGVDVLLDALHRVLAGGELATAIKVKGNINERALAKLNKSSRSLVREVNRFRVEAPWSTQYG